MINPSLKAGANQPLINWGFSPFCLSDPGCPTEGRSPGVCKCLKINIRSKHPVSRSVRQPGFWFSQYSSSLRALAKQSLVIQFTPQIIAFRLLSFPHAVERESTAA